MMISKHGTGERRLGLATWEVLRWRLYQPVMWVTMMNTVSLIPCKARTSLGLRRCACKGDQKADVTRHKATSIHRPTFYEFDHLGHVTSIVYMVSHCGNELIKKEIKL
ncbi:uncharacterized protein LOC144232803 isoform X2 [Crocuta crocuta]